MNRHAMAWMAVLVFGVISSTRAQQHGSGELLANCKYYPAKKADGNGKAMVINSTPSSGRSTRARMLAKPRPPASPAS